MVPDYKDYELVEIDGRHYWIRCCDNITTSGSSSSNDYYEVAGTSNGHIDCNLTYKQKEYVKPKRVLSKGPVAKKQIYHDAFCEQYKMKPGYYRRTMLHNPGDYREIDNGNKY